MMTIRSVMIGADIGGLDPANTAADDERADLLSTKGIGSDSGSS